jgi:hypothetical protein
MKRPITIAIYQNITQNENVTARATKDATLECLIINKNKDIKNNSNFIIIKEVKE